MDKNIQIQKNYTSAAKRKWISRIIAVAVILVSMTVMFLFIFPPSEAECTVDLVNDSYIKVIFNGEVKDASVSVDFISYDGRIVAEHTFTFNRGSEFLVRIDDVEFSGFPSRIEVTDVQGTRVSDEDTLFTVCLLCVAVSVLSLIMIIKIRSKKLTVDGHEVEIYAGNVRRYVRVDGVIAAHKANDYFMKTRLEAAVGEKKIMVNISWLGKIEVTEAQGVGEAEITGTEKGGTENKEMYIEEKETRTKKAKKRTKEAVFIRVIYSITIVIMLAFIAAAIAMAVLKAHYVFILVFAATAVFAGIVGFKCRYKSYDIDGHEVVLYSGLFKKHIRVDGEVIESGTSSRYVRTVVLHARAGENYLEATFTGYRYLDLKITNAEK